MRSRRRFLRSAIGITAGASLHAVASAQLVGMSRTPVLLGSSLALTGVVASGGIEHTKGIRAAVNDVNRAGGLNGRELKAVFLDDGFAPARSAENIKKLLEDGALAFASLMGTANTAACITTLEAAGSSLVGPVTGASSVRRAEVKSLFHIRPSYADEIRRLVEQMQTLGMRDIAVVYQDNALGKESFTDAERAFIAAGIRWPIAVPLSLDGANAAGTAQAVLGAKAGAVLLLTTGTASTDFVLALRQSAPSMSIVGLSITFTDIPRLGAHIQGLACSSIFPTPRSTKHVLIREYQASMRAAGLTAGVGTSSVEGYINARVAIEGIRRGMSMARSFSRESVRSGLVSLRNFRIGDLSVDFRSGPPWVSPTPVSLAVYGHDGVLRA